MTEVVMRLYSSTIQTTVKLEGEPSVTMFFENSPEEFLRAVSLVEHRYGVFAADIHAIFADSESGDYPADVPALVNIASAIVDAREFNYDF